MQRASELRGQCERAHAAHDALPGVDQDYLEHGSVIPLRRLGQGPLGLGNLRGAGQSGEMRDVTPLVADGRIRVKELHTHTFPLTEFEEAFATFNGRRDGALKEIIEP